MKAHAEIAQVWVRDDHLRLVGRIHGHRPDPAVAWSLELVVRDVGEPRLRYPAHLTGTRFDASLPADDLAPESLDAPATWDVYLTPAPFVPGGDEAYEADEADEVDEAAPRLRAGRLLDDIKGKKKIMVYPAHPVRRSAGTVLVRPYYTINDYLAVECLHEKATATSR